MELIHEWLITSNIFCDVITHLFEQQLSTDTYYIME